jgi:hypothetical protein
VPGEVKATHELPIGEGDRQKLYQTNAEQVLRL